MRVQKVASPGGISQRWSVVLSTLDAECFPDDEPCQLYNYHWWVVMDGGKAVAYAGMGELEEGGDTGVYLCRAGVLPGYHGRRLQARMIRARLLAARVLGRTWAVTYTMPHNPASSNSLIRCGFKTYLPQYAWSGDEVIYWYKDL